MVVVTVWTKRAVIGDVAVFQSTALKTAWLINDPDSIPQSTKAKLLPTSIQAIKSWGLSKKDATSFPLRLLVESISTLRRFAETKAISIPEKKPEATSDTAIVKSVLEASGSIIYLNLFQVVF